MIISLHNSYINTADIALAGNAPMTDQPPIYSYRLIQVEGEDAIDFLHNQFTNDFSKLEANRHHLTAYCNPKGRVMTLFRACKAKNCQYLIIPTEQAQAICKRLSMFVLRAKVKILEKSAWHYAALPSDKWQLMQDIHASTGFSASATPNLFEANDSHFVLHSESGTTEFWSTTHYPEINDPKLQQEAMKITISQGILPFHGLLTEAYLPQMLNLDLIGAVNFKKGCYPGQEIVARTQYLGKLKKRTLHYRYTGQTHPAINDTLINASGDEAGTVVALSLNDNQTADILAVVRDTYFKQTLFLQTDHQNALSREPLPYHLPEETIE